MGQFRFQTWRLNSEKVMDFADLDVYGETGGPVNPRTRERRFSRRIEGASGQRVIS
jgi:hypothetical protein